MVVGRADIGVIGAHRVERPLPQVAGEGEHVGLVHQREVLAGAGLGQLVGVADAPLDPHARVDRALGGHLVRRALPQHAALAHVRALGVLADDDHVDALVGVDEGPLVDVEVEVEAHLEQQAALDQAGRHLGRAHRADQQGVEPPPLVEHAVGQDRAVAQVAGAAQVVVDRVELDAGGADDLEGLGRDLGPDAVAADDCDLVAHCCSVVRLVCVGALGPGRPPVHRPEKQETAHRSGRSTADIGGADVRYWMMITGVPGRFIACKCPPLPASTSTELLAPTGARSSTAPRETTRQSRATLSRCTHEGIELGRGAGCRLVGGDPRRRFRGRGRAGGAGRARGAAGPDRHVRRPGRAHVDGARGGHGTPRSTPTAPAGAAPTRASGHVSGPPWP